MTQTRYTPLVTPGLTRGPASSLFGFMERTRGGWLYIMADRYRGGMFVGVTANLAARIQQHQSGRGSVHCAEHRLTRLVWSDHGDDIVALIAHEKRMKRWRREWKFDLIERCNPNWIDLAGTLI